MSAPLLLRLRSLSPARLITYSPSAPRRSPQVVEAISTAAQPGEATRLDTLHDLTVSGRRRCQSYQPPVVDRLPDFSWGIEGVLPTHSHITCTHAQKKVTENSQSPAMFESCSQDLDGGNMVNIEEAV